MKQEKSTVSGRKYAEQGRRLKECLKRADMKQTELKERLEEVFGEKLAIQFISNIATGRKQIPRHRIDDFASILNVRSEYLLLKDDYMTLKDMISDMIGKQEEIDEASFGLLDALGYRFGDVMQKPDGSHESMHRPYSRITINKQIDEWSHEDTDAEILEKAHNAPPVRYFVVTSPGGERFQIEQEDFKRIINDISDFARFKIEQARQHYFRHKHR